MEQRERTRPTAQTLHATRKWTVQFLATMAVRTLPHQISATIFVLDNYILSVRRCHKVCISKITRSNKMSVKAALKIVLMANETMVAECEDPSLWQKVLAAIGSSKQDEIDQPLDEPIRGAKDLPPKTSKTDSKEKFAKELDVSLAVVEAACSPSEKSPFIHLDKHNWEALEKN